MVQGILQRAGYKDGYFTLELKMDGEEAARAQLQIMMAHVDGGTANPVVHFTIKAPGERRKKGKKP